MATNAKTSNQPPKDIMGWLSYYLVEKAPFQIPAGAREALVKFIPIADVVLLVLMTPAILLALGLGAIALPFAAMSGVDSASGMTLALVALAAQVVLMVMALPGLFARRMSGWTLIFYGLVVSLVHSVLNLQIIGGLVGFAIGAYLLFQIRSYYSNK